MEPLGKDTIVRTRTAAQQASILKQGKLKHEKREKEDIEIGTNIRRHLLFGLDTRLAIQVEECTDLFRGCRGWVFWAWPYPIVYLLP